MLKKYAESIPLKTQAQQATTDGHTDLNVLSNTNTMSNFTFVKVKLFSVKQPASCSQQVVFDIPLTLVVTQFALTGIANNFVLVEKTFWQGFEVELAILEILVFIHFCLRRLDSVSHPQYFCCMAS